MSRRCARWPWPGSPRLRPDRRCVFAEPLRRSAAASHSLAGVVTPMPASPLVWRAGAPSDTSEARSMWSCPAFDHLPSVADMDLIVDEIEEFVTGVRRGPDPDRVLLTGVVHRHMSVHPSWLPGWVTAPGLRPSNVTTRWFAGELARYRGRQVTRRVTDSWPSSTAPPEQSGVPWKRHGLPSRWALGIQAVPIPVNVNWPGGRRPKRSRARLRHSSGGARRWRGAGDLDGQGPGRWVRTQLPGGWLTPIKDIPGQRSLYPATA